MVAAAKSTPDSIAKPSRREFLNYALGASVLLAGASMCAGLAWFTTQPQPSIEYTEKNGYFSLDLGKLPQPEQLPVNLPQLRTWLVNTGDGLIALYSVCTFHGCLLKWSFSNYRFECPCCGGKFAIDGKWIEGPAPRDMDWYGFIVTTEQGSFVTPNDGAPVRVDGATSIILDTNQRIPGLSRTVRRNG